MSDPAHSPSGFELQILQVLWEHGPATVRQVMERIGDGKDRAYTSVLSVMQVMQKKGLLKAEKPKSGLAYLYRPKVAREKVLAPLVRGIVDRLFGGSPKSAVQHILQDGDFEADEIRQLRQFLDELESKRQGQTN